jgi:hypothetical protein
MRALAIVRLLCLAAMLFLLCGSSAAQRPAPPGMVSDFDWNARAEHRGVAHRSGASLESPRDGVILNVFPDLTPGAGEYQQGSPSPERPLRRQPRRPSRHGLPTPHWRRNPLLPSDGKTSEA